MIEHACSQARYIEGLAAFRACINRLIAELAQAPPPVDLNGLSVDEQTMIEHACTQERYAQGPAEYRRCRASQLAALQKAPGGHDLSALSPDEQAMVDHACSQERYVQGPAAYRSCVGRQMAALAAAPAVPDLGQLPPDERSMLDTACGRERYVQGPAAYRNCVRRQLAEMAAALASTGDSQASGVTRVREPGGIPRSASTPASLGDSAGSGKRDETPELAAPAAQAPESSWGGSLVVLTVLASLALLAVYIRRQALSSSFRCPSCRRRTSDPGRLCAACEARVDEQRRARSERPAYDDARAEPRPPVEEGTGQEDARRARVISSDDLKRMDQPAFEDLVAGLFRGSGYSVLSPEEDCDEGVDFVLSANGVKDLVLCGQGNAELSLPTLCTFYISMMRAGASHGFVLTKASFQHSAHAFARERAISLVDGTGLLEWVAGRAPKHVGAAHKLPLGGDDPHAVLGIARSATRQQIRQAYLALLKKYHPDRVAHLGEEFRAMAEQRTRAINRAYETLLDHS